jgi:hypothetical protein
MTLPALIAPGYQRTARGSLGVPAQPILAGTAACRAWRGRVLLPATPCPWIIC